MSESTGGSDPSHGGWLSDDFLDGWMWGFLAGFLLCIALLAVMRWVGVA